MKEYEQKINALIDSDSSLEGSYYDDFRSYLKDGIRPAGYFCTSLYSLDDLVKEIFKLTKSADSVYTRRMIAIEPADASSITMIARMLRKASAKSSEVIEFLLDCPEIPLHTIAESVISLEREFSSLWEEFSKRTIPARVDELIESLSQYTPEPCQTHGDERTVLMMKLLDHNPALQPKLIPHFALASWVTDDVRGSCIKKMNLTAEQLEQMIELRIAHYIPEQAEAEAVIHFVKTGEESKLLTDLCKKSLSSIYYGWESGSYSLRNRWCSDFLAHLTDDSPITHNMFQLGIMCQTVDTLKMMIERKIDLFSYTVTPTQYAHKAVVHSDTALLSKIIASDPESAVEGAKLAGEWQVESIIVKLAEENRELYFPWIFNYAQQSKKVLKQLMELYPAYEPAFQSYLEMIKSSKQNIREAGVKLLAQFKKDEVTALFQEMHKNEKSKAVITALNDALQTQGLIEEMVQLSSEMIMKKAAKAKFAAPLWISMNTLPKLHFKEDSAEVPAEVLTYFMSLISRSKTVVPDFEAKQMAGLFTQESLFNFASEVLIRWNRDSKTKWVLGLAALTKDDRFAAILFKEIETMIDQSRGAMAAMFVKAISMIGTPKAIQKVDWISRKIRHKQVKNAAVDALETAAEDLGISSDALLDMIVPTFGLSPAGSVEYDFGSRQFIVSLQADLSLAIVEKESGKTVKSLPKANAKDDPEKAETASKAFSELKKGVKEQVKIQAERLESSLSRQRSWTFEAWKKLFLENPFMQVFAKSLIWGELKEGTLAQTFRFTDEGEFVNLDDDTISLAESAELILIHPIQLSEEDLSTWKEQLDDYEIVQPIMQLNRPIYQVSDVHAGQKELLDFQGFVVSNSTLQTQLFRKNWNRGSVQDAGSFYEYYKEDSRSSIGVNLEFTGACVGYYEIASKGALKKIVFYRSGTVARGSYVYDTAKDENIIPLKDVPPQLFSEVYRDIKQIADSGEGFDPEWEKRDYWS